MQSRLRTGPECGRRVRRLTIPISSFQALAEKHPVLNSGDEPSLLLITTFGEDVGLEVSQVEIVGRQGDSP